MSVCSFHLIREGERAATGLGRSRRAFWLALLAPVLVAFGGCGTVTFKRGASPDAMHAAERSCGHLTADDAAYIECMREHGFFVSGTAAATAGAAPVAHGAAPSVPVAGQGVAVTAPVPAPAVAPAAAAAAVAVEVPATSEVEVPTELDPLDLIDVASWWRLGGSATDLDRATDDCVEELGEEHRPEPGSRAVTAAMYDCLRAVGWRPFGGKGPR